MNSEEYAMAELKEIAKLLDLSIEDVKNNHKKLEDCDATYYWNPARGGLSLIVASNGEYLCATSSVSFEKLFEEFKMGKRNGKLNDNVFTSYVGMNSTEIKTLIEEKIALLKDKLDGKIDDNEKENAGYLLWNCKMILRNICMAYDKLTSKFKEELTSEEISNFTKKSELIRANENNWKDIENIKETFNLLIDTKD